MPEAIHITNSECPDLGKYDAAVLAAEAQFRATADTADIGDTLVVDCPVSDCKLAFELYLDDSHLGRSVRHGIFGEVCVRHAQQNKLPPHA